jgi:hypothetical protein
VGLFYAVSGADHELKEVRADARIDERSLTFTNSSPSRLMINFLGLLSTAVPEGRILTIDSALVVGD